MQDFALIIGGKRVAGAAGTMPVLNPATEEAFADCPVADTAQLEAAVATAKAAFPGWAATPVAERARLTAALANALLARKAEFARLLTREQGKPLDQAEGEILASVETLHGFAAMAPALAPRTVRDTPTQRVIEYRAPLGIVAAITPWNYPLVLLANKLGPALVAGNTLIAKPAPTTPLTTLALAEMACDLLPPGVFSALADRNDLGPALTTHPDIAKLAFTGSTATGRKALAAAAATVKRVTLELGGNDAALVLDDADPVATARAVYQGAMTNAGQVCLAVKRAYVPAAMMDAFCAELARLADATVLGAGDRPGVQMGPLQNRIQYDKVLAYLDDARAAGTIIAGGTAPDRPGYFVAPTIVRDVDPHARIVREEQFGPILPVLAYDTVEDALAQINDSEYGLGATVWSADPLRAADVAARIESGTVWVNQHLALEPGLPYRGAKQSGFGGELGVEGLYEYTQPRLVNIRLGSD